MRVRDVMSSPVITVPPDMRLKEIAELLVTHGISAVPVVADGQLVGIVSEADLVPLDLTPDPRAHPTSRRLATLLARDVPGVVAVRLDEE